jgi:predicted Zn finger-like uncharacterized protein
MLIVCPSCATAYEVAPATLGPSGRQVRCVRCREVWRAESQAEELLAAAAALAREPERGSPADTLLAAAGEEIAATPAAPSAGSSATEWIDPPPGTPPDAAPVLAASAGTDDVAAGSSSDGTAVEVEAPPIAPVDIGEGKPPIVIDGSRGSAQPSGQPEDIETVAARRLQRGSKRRGHAWMLSRLQTAILALLIADAVLVGWRTDIVRVLPQTASFYAAMGLPVNLRGLSFDEVATSLEAHDGVPILVVQGKIVNDTGAVIDVPRLKLIVRNAAKQEIYSWTAVPPQARLSAYQEVTFRARLASPPAESHDVLIRFLNHRDFVAEER